MELDTLIIWGTALILGLLTMMPFYLRRRKQEAHTREANLKALKYGLKEPATMHPVVNPSVCIGTGNCVAACPEKDVLGLQKGQAIPVSPARCVGHGLCERSCPVEAIELVFGTEKRGVDLPRIRGNFETNVDGIYIVGELGGMGLIWNAFEQGRQCIEGILKEKRTTPPDALDVLIVGCGPAGLSASLNALHYNLNFLTVEKEVDVGGAVRSYPRKKLVMTSPFKVPGYGKLKFREIRKEALVDLWQDMIDKTGLKVNTNEIVESVNPTPDGCFRVQTSAATYKTRRVILAIGRRGVPRKLGIPGEDSCNVSYSLREPDHFQDNKIIVVGGGDSAVEAALALADQPGNEVWISYRKEQFSRLKLANMDRAHAALSAEKLNVLWATTLTEIDEREVVYTDAYGRQYRKESDYVFVFIGGVLPTKFLDACGIAIDTKFGTP